MIGWLDIVLAVIIVAAVVIGLIKGLLRELIGLAAVVGGFWAGSSEAPWPPDFWDFSLFSSSSSWPGRSLRSSSRS